MNPDAVKKIKFIYENNENVFDVGQSVALEVLINTVKRRFHIPDRFCIYFINIRTNESLIPGKVVHFWHDASNQMPIYKIILVNHDENDVQAEGRCESFMKYYILPFL
ncbi:unnamed protein product, partial [Rotaria socialis]